MSQAKVDGVTQVRPQEEEQPLKMNVCSDEPPAVDMDENGKPGDVGGRRMTGMFQFANTEAIKEKVRSQKLKKDPYNVHQRYHETGIFQQIARNPVFENVTLGIIVLNAIWIWIDTDWNKGETLLDADTIFVFADCAFFGYFSFELFVRFAAFKRKCDCFKDGWFVFDTTLVTLYAFDPFTIALIVHVQDGGSLNLPTAVLRLFRLARLSRLVRMLRSLPELMIMIKGMLTAAASVGYTLGLLMVITYVFAIALVNLATEPEEGEEACCSTIDGDPATATGMYFETVLEAMHNLIVYATFLDDLSDFIMGVKDDSPVCFIISWIYIALAALTVMNMLIGVLCEVISAVAEEEKESMMCEKVNDKFGEIVNRLDKNNDGTLCWDEFQKILDYPDALKALGDVNVDPEAMVDMAEDLFFEDGEPITLTFEEFMEMVLDLRGGQEATVKDVMSLGKRFSHKFMNNKMRIDNIEKKMDNVNNKFDGLFKHLGLDTVNHHPVPFLKSDSLPLNATDK